MMVIENIRTKFGRKGTNTLVAIVLFSMVGVAIIPSLLQNFLGTYRSIAIVNGFPIPLQEFRQRYLQMEQHIQRYREQLGPQADMILAAMGIPNDARSLALQQLIDETLLLQLAEKNNLAVSPEFVIDQLNNPQFVYEFLGAQIPAHLFRQDGTIDTVRLGKFLQHQGSSLTQFEEQLERSFVRYVVASLAEGAHSVSESEVQASLMAQEGTRSFTVTEIPLKAYKDAVAKDLSDAEVASYFERRNKQAKAYWTPEQRSATVWTFDLKDFGITEPTETTLEKAYQEQKEGLYKGKTFAQAKKNIKQDLMRRDFTAQFNREAGHLKTDHPEVLRTFVEAKKAQKSTVACATAEKSTVPAALKGYLFSLSTAKQRATAVDGDKAYVLEVTEINKPAAQPLEAVKATVIDDIRTEKAREMLAKELKKSTFSHATHQKTVSWAPGNASASFKDLIKEGLSEERMLKLIKQGSAFTMLTNKAGYIVELKDITMPVAPADKQATLKKQLSQNHKRSMLSSLIASLRENATITSNEGSLQTGPQPLDF